MNKGIPLYLVLYLVGAILLILSLVWYMTQSGNNNPYFLCCLAVIAFLLSTDIKKNK